MSHSSVSYPGQRQRNYIAKAHVNDTGGSSTLRAAKVAIPNSRALRALVFKVTGQILAPTGSRAYRAQMLSVSQYTATPLYDHTISNGVNNGEMNNFIQNYLPGGVTLVVAEAGAFSNVAAFSFPIIPIAKNTVISSAVLSLGIGGIIGSVNSFDVQLRAPLTPSVIWSSTNKPLLTSPYVGTSITYTVVPGVIPVDVKDMVNSALAHANWNNLDFLLFKVNSIAVGTNFNLLGSTFPDAARLVIT